ncbi:MAG: zinc ribbon domain-containing protein [Candidatus Bathyarchaeia archaeon]
MSRGFSQEVPRKGSLMAVLLGLVVSILIGTLLLLVDYEGLGGEFFVEIGALLGGIIVGRMLFHSTRQSILMGATEGLLSFLSYFFIVPMLLDAGLIPNEPPPDISLEIYLILMVMWIILSAASGALGAYFGSLLGRWTTPHPPSPPPYPEIPRMPSPMGMKKCPYCHTDLPSEALYCPECGRRVR